MMLDWLDPSLVKADPLNVNWKEHYWPNAEILNLTPDSPDLPKPEEFPPKLKLDKDKKFGGMCTELLRLSNINVSCTPDAITEISHSITKPLKYHVNYPAFVYLQKMQVHDQ